MIDVDEAVLILERIHIVEAGCALGAFEPAHLRHIAIARHDRDQVLQILMMDPVRATRLDPIQIGRGRLEREDRVIFGDDEIMHHRAMRAIEPLFADQFSVLVRIPIGHGRRGETGGLIAEDEHLLRLGIDADMRRHRLGLERAIEIIFADGFERMRVDERARPILLGHDQATGMPDRRGVGDRALHVLHDFDIGVGIAIAAEQALAGFMLGLPARGLHIFDIIIDSAVRIEQHAVDHAVIGQGRVRLEERRELRIGNGAEESADNICGDCALGRLQSLEGDFLADGRIETGIIKRCRE